MTEVKLCSRGDERRGRGGVGEVRRGQQHSASRPQGWMVCEGCASVQIVCLCVLLLVFMCCLGHLSVLNWHINLHFMTVSNQKREVTVYHFSDPCFLINSPHIYTTSSLPVFSFPSSISSSSSTQNSKPCLSACLADSLCGLDSRAGRCLKRWGAVASR